MASGFHSFVFKKDVQTIRRYSADTADILEQIYQNYGAHAGYSAANAIKKIMASVNTAGGAAGSNWQAEMRECPQAMLDARRAVDVFLYDFGAVENNRWSRE
ncbi:MAG: hypothetical protein SF162_15430 [bacterium]|nr:hypothetical protein [bacterium]